MVAAVGNAVEKAADGKPINILAAFKGLGFSYLPGLFLSFCCLIGSGQVCNDRVTKRLIIFDVTAFLGSSTAGTLA